jgi:hypothetical protein
MGAYAPEVVTEPQVELSVDSVSKASHPAIARAVEEILRGQSNETAFSNFVSHSSATS